MRKAFRRCIGLLSAAALTFSGCTAPESDPTEPERSDPQVPQGQYANLTVTIGENELAISDHLFGLFLEDINFAVDAGLYTELIKNRSFEYGSMAANEGRHGWQTTSSSAITYTVANGSNDKSWLNENNPSYLVLTNDAETMEGIYNTGYLDGMAVSAGESYTASLYIRGDAQVKLSLEHTDGTVYAEAELTAKGDSWTKYAATLTPTETVSNGLRFVVRISKGTVHMDMVSLMTQDGFAGLPIRKDIGEYLQALNPSFLRFPGGCAVEGKTLESMYSWKDSIGNAIPYTINGENAVGDIATRPQTIDIWNGNKQHPYYCTYGLGFYEYFLLCEALECMPLPVLNAGMTCPIQSPNYTVFPTNSEEFQQCVQDALDLVEFCKGGADTKWGAVRIAMGHQDPFELKYVGIGNEQWQSEYFEHYEFFLDAFRDAAKKSPEIYGGIELIVANGPASGSTEGWTYVKRNPDELTTLVDEHYYEPPAWFLANTKRYDAYDRSLSAKVFLGEYASQSNTMHSALAEAAYMTGLERNGDVVELACYAPLFGNATLNQWLPDMIFFSKDSLYGTPNYYVQKLFGNNAGNTYLQTDVEILGDSEDSVLSGRVGLGSWQTSVAYDNIKVVSNDDGKVLYEDDFSDPVRFEDEYDIHRGDWTLETGRLVQKSTGYPSDETTGEAVYVGDAGWSNYTMTVDATILEGAEGFLIPICVENSKNNIFWNLGGWGNSVSCLQIVSGGAKSGQVSGTIKNCRLEHGKTYQLKITVSGNNIKCFVDGIQYLNYTEVTPDPIFASTVRDENGDLIVKIVNVSGNTVPVVLNLPGLEVAAASVTTLKADSAGAVNSFDDPTHISPEESTLEVSERFTYEALPYSLTVIRIPQK